jgi:diguanylate cyclase (GGDEF)-like protein
MAEANSRMSQIPGPGRRQPLDSLATKIILFVFVSTFATAMVVSWISIKSTHDYLSSRLDRQFPAALSRSRAHFSVWFDQGLTALRDQAERRDAPSARDLARIVAKSEFVDGLALYGADGSSKRVAGRDARSGLADAHPPFDPTRTGIHNAVTSGGERLTWAALPLADGERHLVAILSETAIETALRELPTEMSESILIVDARGQRLFDASPGESHPRSVPEELLANPASKVLEYTNAAGFRVIASALPLDIANWHLVAEAPFELVFEPVVSVVKRIFVIDLCVILLFSFLAYKITAAILQPIELLSDGARRIAQGQLDHEIPEPSTHDEIGLLTHTFNDMMRKLRGNQGEIEDANELLLDRNLQLQQANEILEQLSITDGLTKLHNHRFFQDHLTREIKRVNRVKEPLSMILVDVDDFKSLNDRLGHAAGDELLRRVAMLMNDSIRESDLLARYGGDEFVVLASDTDLAGANRLAEKIRTSIAESSFIVDESLRPTRATLSMGVAQYTGTRKRFFAAADAALYRAKAQGKNCVATDDEEELP